jgi:hypothetical protein
MWPKSAHGGPLKLARSRVLSGDCPCNGDGPRRPAACSRARRRTPPRLNLGLGRRSARPPGPKEAQLGSARSRPSTRIERTFVRFTVQNRDVTSSNEPWLIRSPQRLRLLRPNERERAPSPAAAHAASVRAWPMASRVLVDVPTSRARRRWTAQPEKR